MGFLSLSTNRRGASVLGAATERPENNQKAELGSAATRRLAGITRSSGGSRRACQRTPPASIPSTRRAPPSTRSTGASGPRSAQTCSVSAGSAHYYSCNGRCSPLSHSPAWTPRSTARRTVPPPPTGWASQSAFGTWRTCLSTPSSPGGFGGSFGVAPTERPSG